MVQPVLNGVPPYVAMSWGRRVEAVGVGRHPGVGKARGCCVEDNDERMKNVCGDLKAS